MPDHGSRPFSAGQDQALHVASQQVDAVSLHSRWFVREVVAAHIRSDYPETGLDQRWDLMPPLIPELWEAVQEQHERSLPRLDVVQPHIPQIGVAVRWVHRA